LSEVPDALRYLEEGHARGKVVIMVEWPSTRLHLVAARQSNDGWRRSKRPTSNSDDSRFTLHAL